uniref:aldehyde oxygenase (deformylating) n=1 Tax=Anthurium amnicola TaxID=1678845 RepID=A0A1D1YHS2_9ARAE
MVYFLLFAIPMLATVVSGSASIVGGVGYLLYLDFMNYMGHCNFELVPEWLFRVFPPLKYLMYTPSFHSLHHTQFRTNYSLFMPLYDYVYGTTDKSTNDLYKNTLRGTEETPDVVHLTHLTTLQSICHLRLGFASLASKPYSPKWYGWMMWPLACWSLLLSRICGSAFVVERNRLRALALQTWAIPRFSFQYTLSWEREAINDLIEKAVLEAERRGVKVISLGLLNQGEELNTLGDLYIHKHPKLRIRIVDGSNLAAAAVIHSIPGGTREVLLSGKLSKVAYIVAKVLCQRSTQVITVKRDEFEMLKLRLPTSCRSHLVLSKGYTPKVWLVGDGLTTEEQRRAVKGTCFIPFTQFPTQKTRRDCVYYSNPALVIPKEFENMHSCENWLPRRVMSACRVAGIVHALEDWKKHEVGDEVADVERVWRAALSHGFLPLPSPLAD